MAKFSVCRIYKVTLWLNFSYNYSVNLLQILHLYIHPLFGKHIFNEREPVSCPDINPVFGDLVDLLRRTSKCTGNRPFHCL